MAELQPFAALLQRVRPEVERALSLSWELAWQEHASLGPAVSAPLAAARELCLRGGKRLRAALVAAGYRIAGGDADLAPCLPLCCAVELLHAYFLIHDDWIDQDELRRGGPSVHAALEQQLGSAHLGAAGAVLAGDYTAALATRVLLQAPLPAERQAQVLSRFVAMQMDAVVGQQLDVLGDGSNLDEVYRLKTGSYTVLGPLLLGAALGEPDAELNAALEAFALPLGIAFQLRDDLLGAFGDPMQTGKPRGSDLLANKRTLLLQAALHSPKCRAALEGVLGNPAAPAQAVSHALDVIAASGARARVEARIAELVARAARATNAGAISTESRALLQGMLAALVDRGT
jgi:geranylgeranyl diphosphate synthase, type I